LGESVEFEGQAWTIVGLLDGGGRVYDQEIWVDLDELAAAANRLTFSSYTLLVRDSSAVPALVEELNEGRRYPLTAQAAAEFYARTGGMEIFMAFLGTFISIVIALGAGFAGMNTMYAAVAGRRREIGVLRALGFGRGAILTSFLLESIMLCLAGGVIGLALGWALSFVPIDLPLLPSSHVGLGVPQALQSLVLAATVGLIGGGLPALQAAKLTVVDALR
jgi:putative ABC transport system permease protein